MNASKDLWSISAERNKMPMEVYQVSLKGLAQAQRGLCLGWWSCCQPHPWGHTAAFSARPHHNRTLLRWPLTTLINGL